MLEISAFCGGICATNGYLLESSDGGGAVVIDAPEGMAAWIEARGCTPSALLLTHQHFDHVEDVAALVDRFSLPVYGWSEPSADLTLEDWAKEMGIDPRIAPYPVDHVLSKAEDALLPMAGVDYRILHVPGHSPDSICFHAMEEGVLLAGDVLMCAGYGRTDFPHGDAELLFDGIRTQLWPLPDETRVLSGHGPETTIGAEKRRGLIV